MDELNTWLIGGGLTIGAIFAIMVQHFRFCLVAGTSNLLLMKDYRQAMAFATALLVAITGTQLLELTGLVAISDSIYRNNTLDWFGTTAGGFLFGIGSALAGGCVTRTLVRTTEGSIHSLLALLAFAIFAAVTQFGFLETLRIDLTNATAISLTTDAGIASIFSLSPWLVLAVVVTGLLAFIIKSWKRSPDISMIIVGIIIGLLVVSSWYVTGVLAQDDFDPIKPSAITMSGPLARFGYILISGRVSDLSFSILFVISTAVVSFMLALATRQFKITSPGKGMIKMSLLGGSLMGVGAIMAYGCNIGQGLSGISTLSMESLFAVIGMVSGITVVTKWMEKHT
ncbi:MAG: YeeE/YedE family protein [Gammaproteobacteria bacterium]|nr:YeeE/YedE family protein [Gammaproteobacteria bacterium]